MAGLIFGDGGKVTVAKGEYGMPSVFVRNPVSDLTFRAVVAEKLVNLEER